MEPLSQPILAIIFGSDNFPKWKTLASSAAFANSANDFDRYLRDKEGLALPDKNILNLFGSSKPVSEQDEEIGTFLSNRIHELRASNVEVKDIIVYYVGHGGFFDPADQYFLALEATRESSPSVSGYPIKLLASTLSQNAPRLRRYLILDCCFSAAAYQAFMSAPLEVAKQKTREALPPSKGTALLCASGPKDPAKTLPGETYTMFSGAFLDVLKEGLPGASDRISLAEVGDRAVEIIQERFPDGAVRPQVSSPDRAEGDVSSLPLFPNRVFGSPAVRNLVSRLERRILELERAQTKNGSLQSVLDAPVKDRSIADISVRQNAKPTYTWALPLEFLRQSGQTWRTNIFLGLILSIIGLCFKTAAVCYLGLVSASSWDFYGIRYALSLAAGIGSIGAWLPAIFCAPNCPAVAELLFGLMVISQVLGCWFFTCRGGWFKGTEPRRYLKSTRIICIILAAIGLVATIAVQIRPLGGSYTPFFIFIIISLASLEAFTMTTFFLLMARRARAMRSRVFAKLVTSAGFVQLAGWITPILLSSNFEYYDSDTQASLPHPLRTMAWLLLIVSNLGALSVVVAFILKLWHAERLLGADPKPASANV